MALRRLTCASPPPSFQAVLDTALDIAKAMMHLHLADVLHADLKVCSGGRQGKAGEAREGRGRALGVRMCLRVCCEVWCETGVEV